MNSISVGQALAVKPLQYILNKRHKAVHGETKKATGTGEKSVFFQKADCERTAMKIKVKTYVDISTL